MEIEAYKIQFALESSEDDQCVLIYNKDRTVFEEFLITSEILEAMGGDVIRFVWGETGDDGILNLLFQTPEGLEPCSQNQDW